MCVCGLTGDQKLSIPEHLEIVVWTHHREWGLTSNTGCLLPLMLENCKLSMKGLSEHDEAMEREVFSDDECLAVVLWPDQSTAASSRKSKTVEAETITLEEVLVEIKTRRVVLIAVDGTWRNARRMVSRLPASVRRLDLPLDVVYSEQSSEDVSSNMKSLLSPLRSKGPSLSNESERQVCTAEAVVGALLHMGLDEFEGDKVINLATKKVDVVRKYRGKV